MTKVSFLSHDSGLYFIIPFFSQLVLEIWFFFCCGGIQSASRYDVDFTFNKIIELPQDRAIGQAFRCWLVTTEPQITSDLSFCEIRRVWIGTGTDFPQRSSGSRLLALIPPSLHTSVSQCRSIDQTAHYHILRLFNPLNTELNPICQ